MPIDDSLIEQVRRMVRDRWGALVDEVNKAAAERDQAGCPVPVGFYRAAGEQGLTGFSMPWEYGGEGGGPLVWGLIVEHLGYLCEDMSFPLVMSFQPEIAKVVIDHCGDWAIERTQCRSAGGSGSAAWPTRRMPTRSLAFNPCAANRLPKDLAAVWTPPTASAKSGRAGTTPG